MTILLYAGAAKPIGRDHLGTEDYSYRFLLESFRRMFEQAGFGSVIEISDPYEEADPLFEQCVARGEGCMLLSVTPPHRAPVGLACPTICIFAWEFSTIPNEPLDCDPRSDWRYVFAAHGRTIALSRYTAEIVRSSLGDACVVAAIPAPVWDDCQNLCGAAKDRFDRRTIRFVGELRDSAARVELRSQPVWPRPSASLLAPAPIAEPPIAEPIPVVVFEPPPPPPPPMPEPDPEPPAAEPPELVVQPTPSRPVQPPPRRGLRERISLTRHYALEWYRATLRDLLPRPVAMAVSISGRLGYGLYKLVVSKEPKLLRPPAAPVAAAAAEPTPEATVPPVPDIQIEIEPEIQPENAQPESTQLEGVARDLQIHRFEPTPMRKELRLDGIVYVTMLNPTDGRKNWCDIVMAFVWAFRDDPGATLVIKLIHADPAAFHPCLDDILRRLSPFSCRVVTITGYLEAGQLADLVAATDFYVNASHGEGLCLPLMEFMSAGTPVIAPNHTAMADYISSDVAFIVRATPEHNVWPQDPRDLFRTMRYRIEWDSLLEAFAESARVLRSDRARYDTMAVAASQTMRRFCSRQSVLQSFTEFVGETSYEMRNAPVPASRYQGVPELSEFLS